MGKIIIDGVEYGGCVDTTNFTSSDVADADATSWTSVTPITNNEPNVSLFTKLSQIAKNVRYLYKIISKINDTSDLLDSNDKNVITLSTGLSNITGYTSCYYKIGKVVYVHLAVKNIAQNTDTVLCNLPSGYRPKEGSFRKACTSNIGYTADVAVLSTGNINATTQSGNLYCDFSFVAEQ